MARAVPDHQSRWLPALEIVGDGVEPRDVARIVRDVRSLLVQPPRQLHHSPVLLPALRRDARGDVRRDTAEIRVAHVSHGGIALEEVLVPFVAITREAT
jgi:hypothetical protein